MASNNETETLNDPGQHKNKRKDDLAGLLGGRQFGVIALLLQIVFIVLLAIFCQYAPEASPDVDGNGGGDADGKLAKAYPMFQDLHVMIFVGFGFLMTFLKRYGYSAVGINLLLGALVVQWATLIRGFFRMQDGVFSVSISDLIAADFSAAVVLISMGAVLGKLSPTQYLVMAMIETPLAVTAEWVLYEQLQVTDVGGSLVIHLFGAFFGLAIARVISNKKLNNHEDEGTVYHSDLFSLIGTAFLWIFWPSFNAALATPADAAHRAVLNTYYALASATLATFIFSSLTDKKNKFSPMHVQNATLAGGVAIGAVANLVLQPWVAVLIGLIAGFISVIGYQFIMPVLSSKAGVHDSCGVLNLHGLPGIVSGIISIIFAALATPAIYGESLKDIFPAMVPGAESEEEPGRTGGEQAAMQLAGIGVIIGISVVGGIITGVILKINKIWNHVSERNAFNDEYQWNTPLDFATTGFINIRYVDEGGTELRTA